MLIEPQSVENIWPNKIQYSISTPTKAVVFGTSVRIDFRLVSLLKGLRIGQITTQVLESHELTTDSDAASTYYNTHKAQKIIAEDEYVVDDGSEPQVLNEEAEGYEFARHIELPKTLRRCLQDTETRGIKVRHKLKFNVQLHNPDGHVSEVCVSVACCEGLAHYHSFVLRSLSLSSSRLLCRSTKTTIWLIKRR